MKKSTKNFAIGAAVAGVAGYLAGILTAPKSGKETRQDIKTEVNKGLAEAEKQLKKLHTELTTTLAEAKVRLDTLSGSAKDQLNGLLKAATDAKEKVRVMLSSVHEGDAQDKDLERAIKEANAAISHLKDYLKK